MNREVSLEELWPAYRKNAKWIVFSAILVAVLFVLYTSLFVTKKYTSSAKMIASFTTLEQSSDQTPNAVSTGQIDAASSLAVTYSELLKSEYAAKRIYDQISPSWENVSVSLIRGSISIQQVGSTSLLRISITTTNPELSKDICDAFIKVAPDVIYEKFFGQLRDLDSPSMPSTYSSPNFIKNGMIGAVIGAVIAMVMIYVMYIFNNKIRNTDDVEKKYNVPVLGSIPSFDSNRKKSSGKDADKNSDNNDLNKSQKSFFVIESYKNIRTNLLYTINSNSGENVIAISGADSGVGKSVTCTNLAIAFAQSKRRVLVIDADMRKPTQYKLFKKDNTNGLSKVLSGQSDFSEAVWKDVAPGLDLLTSGPTPPNPSELLSSEMMDKLIKEVSKEYDCVLIDTPPINYVTDCLAMARKINGIVLVARQGYTEYNDLSKALENVETVGAKVLGVIVSDVKIENKGKYYSKKYYRSYYVKRNQTE